MKLLWGDGKYNNRSIDRWLMKTQAGYGIAVVGRPAGSVGFVELSRRWVVERTFAWLGRYRRHSRDYERYTHSSEAMIEISSILQMFNSLNLYKTKKPAPFKYRKLQAEIAG